MGGVHSVEVRHNAEMGHRLLSDTASKCHSLHGHSFWFTVEVTAQDLDRRGMVLEYGQLKRHIREWIDSSFDHGVVLNEADPLLPALRDAGCKVYTLPLDPTVEALAMYTSQVAAGIVRNLHPGAEVTRVHVQETHVNSATWKQSGHKLLPHIPPGGRW